MLPTFPVPLSAPSPLPLPVPSSEKLFYMDQYSNFPVIQYTVVIIISFYESPNEI